MRWNNVKEAYPDQWVIIEAIDARTEENERIIEQITVVDVFLNDNNGALRRYVELHKQHPERELYVVHTSRPKLDIKERRWTGVRSFR
ncbi:hypothetical protein [Marinisporobacter balticus]|uniref:Uncharacterized protein n=1 Tax=Marinisporobacter balticus TaxID=2018667 RepID=A0A4R2K6I3_9FIRM|nr:hypothetical protein [Marinisporobacter balticus]TCO68883.1 hypothetical protein EV214_13826 [Marinisporobacter balticus]